MMNNWMLVSVSLAAFFTGAALGAEAAPAAPSAAVAKSAEVGIKDVTPAEAADLLKTGDEIVILDVRTPREFSAGHIAGAKLLDYNAEGFAEKLAALDKSKTYLMHCARGGRSLKTTEMMRDGKFKSVYHMNGGFDAWKEAGKPVEKGRAGLE